MESKISFQRQNKRRRFQVEEGDIKQKALHRSVSLAVAFHPVHTITCDILSLTSVSIFIEQLVTWAQRLILCGTCLLIATVRLINNKTHKLIFWQVIDRRIRKLDEKELLRVWFLLPVTSSEWQMTMEVIDAVEHQGCFLMPRRDVISRPPN